MKRPFSRLLAPIVVLMSFCPRARGQIGPQPGVAQSLPQARLLPLSGRPENGSVEVQTTGSEAAGDGGSVDTVNVQVQGAFQGSSAEESAGAASIPLSLTDAVKRGLAGNLGALDAGTAAAQARALRLAALAALLPDVAGGVRETAVRENLAAEGLKISIPGVLTIPPVISFDQFDARANLTETLSMTGLRNWQAARRNARSAELLVKDSRELVVLAVAATYLRAVALAARVKTARAQILTARAVYDQAADQNREGLNAQIDVTRSQVELQTQEQRLTSAVDDFEKQKLALARLIGLPLSQPFMLADGVPYRARPLPDAAALVRTAFAARADVQAAARQVEAAELTRQAAVDEYLPSLALIGDYGALGSTPSDTHGTYTATAALQFPIFRFGRIRSDVEQADAALRQRRAEADDAKERAEQDVRSAVLDFRAASEQIGLAESNRALAAQTLEQARDRFRAGIADTVEVVQAQEAVAAAESDYINALYSYNASQVSLARAIGRTEQGLLQMLEGA